MAQAQKGVTVFNAAFDVLQKIGKSLMLPVAVLPVAGLLLGIGASNLTWLPPIVSHVMANSGQAVFGNLAVIFAVGVALGLANNDGVSAVAAVVGYYIMVATLAVMANAYGLHPIDPGGPAIDTGVFGGIIIGVVAAELFNRYYRIQLPAYLAFFAGKRFVPIVTGVAAIFVGVVLSLVWPPVQEGINVFSHWAVNKDPRMAATIYGFLERLLVPFGLHHIWNVPFFFTIGDYVDPTTGKHIHGDINRFFAGDPTAGILSGAFLFKMFGLPAAAIAIWRCAKPEHRKAVGGLMLSAALTSFLTGITEPIEFFFLISKKKKFRIRANEMIDEMESNNEAEYAALYYVLNILIELGVHHVPCDIKGDSQVVINQLEGDWPCYEENLNRWIDRIEERIKILGIKPRYQLIPRNDNKEADKLASQALDGKKIYSKMQLL